MKQLISPVFYKYSFVTLLLTIMQAVAWAQDSAVSATSTSTSTTSTTERTWYAEPWVWIVGGAVLILIIVALTRGGGSSSTGTTDRVTVTKTRSVE